MAKVIGIKSLLGALAMGLLLASPVSAMPLSGPVLSGAKGAKAVPLTRVGARAVYNQRLNHWNLEMLSAHSKGYRYSGHRIFGLNEAKVSKALGVKLKAGEELMFMRRTTGTARNKLGVESWLTKSWDHFSQSYAKKRGASFDSGLIFKVTTDSAKTVKGTQLITKGQLIGTFAEGKATAGNMVIGLDGKVAIPAN